MSAKLKAAALPLVAILLSVFALTRTYNTARAPETIGATGDNPAGWTINTGSGNLVSPSKKITGLANGTASGDAVNFGQVVTTSTNGLALATDKKLFDQFFTNGPRSVTSQRSDFRCSGLYTSGSPTISSGTVFCDGWRAAFTNSGTVKLVTTTQDQNHPGILQLETVTSASSTAGITIEPTGPTPNFVFGSAVDVTQEYLVYISALSDGTNTFVVDAGMPSTILATVTDGLIIEYSSAAPSSGNWIGRACSTAGGCTTAAGGSAVTVNAGTWYRLTINWNGATGTASFFADGTSIGTTTSTIPTLPVAPGVHMLRSAGTASKTVLVDYYFEVDKWATPRAP